MRVFLSLPLLAAISLLLGACAGTPPQPLTARSVIGAVPAKQTAVVLHGAFDYSPPEAPLVAVRYQLPPGRYRPVAEDARGVYYQAPIPLRVGTNGGPGQAMTGGIHLANAGGQSYSFPSLWVAFRPGDYTKLGLPENFQAGYGKAWVWTRNGTPMRSLPYE